MAEKEVKMVAGADGNEKTAESLNYSTETLSLVHNTRLMLKRLFPNEEAGPYEQSTQRVLRNEAVRCSIFLMMDMNSKERAELPDKAQHLPALIGLTADKAPITPDEKSRIHSIVDSIAVKDMNPPSTLIGKLFLTSPKSTIRSMGEKLHEAIKQKPDAMVAHALMSF